MRRTFALVAAVALAAMFATSSIAAVRAPTGDRISLFGGDIEYPAGAPFFVRHGIATIQDEDEAIGRGRFVLEIDGVPQQATYTEHFVADGLIYRMWVFNHPDGLSGVHAFTGHWLTACDVALMFLPCGDGGRQELTDFERQQIVVTFTE